MPVTGGNGLSLRGPRERRVLGIRSLSAGGPRHRGFPRGLARTAGQRIGLGCSDRPALRAGRAGLSSAHVQKATDARPAGARAGAGDPRPRAGHRRRRPAELHRDLRPSSPRRATTCQAKIAAAVGPDYTVGSKKSEQARVWIRSWLEGVTEDPAKRILTIDHTATEFHSGMGDEVNIYYFGREATSMGPGGRQPEGHRSPGKASRSSPRRRKPRARAASRPSTRCSPAASRCSWTGSSSTPRCSSRSRCASPSTACAIS